MKGLSIALGYFDSVHLGHKKIIKKCLKVANLENLTPSIFTFDDDFLQKIKQKDAKVVFTLEERKTIYVQLGIEDVVVFPTDNEHLNYNCQDFHNYLLNLGVKNIVVGSDFTYAKNAAGNVETLKAFAKDNEIGIYIESFEMYDGEKISSHSIKKLIAEGKVGLANKLMGRDFFVDGVVVHGKGVGGSILNYATANIIPDYFKVLPTEGVYATITYVLGEKYLSVTNVGTQPTLDCYNEVVESHLLNFSNDIYGMPIRVAFLGKIREVQKFENVTELKNRISSDVEEVINNYGKYID